MLWRRNDWEKSESYDDLYRWAEIRGRLRAIRTVALLVSYVSGAAYLLVTAGPVKSGGGIVLLTVVLAVLLNLNRTW